MLDAREGPRVQDLSHAVRGQRLLIGVAIVAAGAIVGLALGRLPHLPVVVWLAAGPTLIALALAVAAGSRWCLYALLALDILGLFTVGAHLGPGEVRLFDLPYVALVAAVLLQRVKDGTRPRAPLGQRAIAVWLLALGFSLYPLFVRDHGATTNAVIDWLRFVQTVSLLWLVPYALRKLRDLEVMLGIIALSITLDIGGAMIKAIIDGGVDRRFRLSAGNSANATGLLAALLILMAFHSPVPRRRALRITMLVVGCSALVLAKSLGAIAAVTIALALFGFSRPAADRPRGRASLLMPLRVLVVVLAALAVATLVKGGNLPGSQHFDQSSTMHRTILATAGLELFADHPLTGVGWESAPSPAEARSVNTRLKQRFGNDVNPQFYPEATMPGRIFEHNAYVQILAETGLVGFGLFVVAAVAAIIGIGAVLSIARAQPAVYVAARCLVVLLVAILVWLNDNTLFGLQPETVLAATLIGALAAIPLMVDRGGGRREHEPGADTAVGTAIGR